MMDTTTTQVGLQEGIVCNELTYAYGKTEILHHVSLRLHTGVTGLLGTNGAGKTTLLNVLSTLKQPSHGDVQVAGVDVLSSSGRATARKRLGYLSQSFEVMGFSSVRSNIQYAAWAHGMKDSAIAPATDRVMRTLGLTQYADTRARALSGGSRQRLGIACVTVHNPQVLILDEPTVGVDPLQRNALRQLIASLGKHATVLFSTHLVDDVARVADHLLIMSHGSIAFDDSIDTAVASQQADAGDPALVPSDRADAIGALFERVAG